MFPRPVIKRKNLIPAEGVYATEGTHAMRRSGARWRVSERVVLQGMHGEEFHGWALNLSRGGVRVILEDKVAIADEFVVTLGDSEPASGALPRARVVWVQEERDGVVAGLEFIGHSGMHRAVRPVER